MYGPTRLGLGSMECEFLFHHQEKIKSKLNKRNIELEFFLARTEIATMGKAKSIFRLPFSSSGGLCMHENKYFRFGLVLNDCLK